MTDHLTKQNSAFSVVDRTKLPQWFSEWLDHRRILDPALTMGWQPHKHGAKYPVFDPETGEIVAERWKAASGQSRHKYLWIPAGRTANYYTAPGLPDTIAGADGLLWVANGEPSVLAFHAAGIKNVLSWFGEGSIPKSVVKDFLAMGVSRVIYLPDNDYAGYQAAIKFRDMLQGSGIDYEFKTWGKSQVDLIHVDKTSGKQTPYIACDDVPAKADANDIWKLVAADSASFTQRLSNAPVMQLPTPEPKRQQAFDDSEFEETPQGLIDAIASALGIERYKPSGWSKHVTSPFREDRNPSFSLNSESGVGIDWGDNKRSYSPTQIAERFGIDWRRFYPQRERREASGTSDDYGKPESSCEKPAAPGQVWFPEGLPDSWRSLLLNYMGKTAAAIIEMANEAARRGLLDASCFCVDDLIIAMGSTQFRLSAKTIRNQFAELKTIFFPESDTLNTNNKRNTLSDSGNNSCGGRPTTSYAFQSLTTTRVLLIQRVKTRIEEHFMPPNQQDSVMPIYTGDMLQAEGMGIPDEQAALTATVLNKHEAVNKVHAREAQRRQIIEKRIDWKFRKEKASLSDVHSTPLINTSISNGAAYRDLFYKSKLLAETVAERSRAQIAALVGIQPQQVTALHKRVKVESIERKPKIEVKSAGELTQLEYKGLPLAVVVTDKRTGQTGEYKAKYHNIREIANEAFIDGNQKVEVRVQIANEQRLMAAAKRLYKAHGKYLMACWVAAHADISPSEVATPAANEQKIPVQRELFPAETKQAPPHSPQPPKAVRPGQYYRAGYDPAWVAEHLNRVLLIVDSPYRLKVLTLVGQNESLEYRVRMVTTAGVDVGRLTDKLLLHAIHIDPVAAEAVMLGGIAQ